MAQTLEEKELVRIVIQVPPEWRIKLKKIARKKGYASVSELIRELIRENLIG